MLWKNNIYVKCIIKGIFLGEEWTYKDTEDKKSLCIHYDEEPLEGDPSTFHWTENNFSCDCNRYQFLPKHLQEKFDEIKGNNEDTEEYKGISRCSELIKIEYIKPLEEDKYPSLEMENGELF